MRYSLIQVLRTVAPFRPSFLTQPRVSSRNQPLLASSAPRSANISPILSTLRILPVATGLPTMVGVYLSSAPLKTSRCIQGESHRRRKSRRIIPLRTLFLSLRSFPRSHRLFSIACGLFSQNTGGGIPLRDLVRCTEAQKCLSVSPLLATLTHSVSRKSFPCHSYANTRDGGATVAPVSPSILVSVQPRTSNLEPLPLRALDTAGSAAYGFAQSSRGNRKLR